ncbi:MAG: hypothetical protein H0Z24_03210 [Thermosipho sp. (in: Bacteria)]|nr:hypothetical protein [Thermosipho sp. (in: thermotogales)]
MINIMIEKILKENNIKLRVKYNDLDAEILNKEEILKLNKVIHPLRFEIDGGYIALLDEKMKSLIV